MDKITMCDIPLDEFSVQEKNRLKFIKNNKKYSKDEREVRLNMKRIFDQVRLKKIQVTNSKLNLFYLQLDEDGDGYLSYAEMKVLFQGSPNKQSEVPKGFYREICKHEVFNDDDKIHFERFYELSRANKWIIRDWCVSYCRGLVAPRTEILIPRDSQAKMSQSSIFEEYDDVGNVT
jgi:hypothetical protein